MNFKQFSSVIILLLMTVPAIAQTVIEVIPVINRPAEEIQPLLQSLLDENDHVIADGSNLLVKTSPERLAQIKAFISQLDSRQQNLMITVLQSTQATADELNSALRAQVTIQTERRLQSTGAIAGHVYQTQDANSRENTQTIRTLEGNAAFIKTGNSYPVQNVQINNGYGYPSVSTQTQFIEASTGFEVIPRLNGEQVTLEVSPWSEHMTGRGQIQSQAAQSSLRVKLGEWVELGGVTQNSQRSSSGGPANIRQTGTREIRLLIKVDKVD